MPIYCWKCPTCGRTKETFEHRPMPKTPVCACGCDAIVEITTPYTVREVSHTVMERDMRAENVESTDVEYDKPLLSDAAGIHPNQIADARSKFPHHEYTPDGRMVFRSHSHRERCLRDIGMVDRDGYR